VKAPLKSAILFCVLACCMAACSSEPPPAAAPEKASIGSIERLDPALDALVPPGAEIEKLADGFTFIEGPLWRPSGAVWFSDVVANVVLQWSPDGSVSDVLRPGGYDGDSLPAGGYNGPNGMVGYKDGSVLLCQHGNRRIAQISADRQVTTFLDNVDGKKLNSPNDLVFHSDGSLYFTDPPFGLPKMDSDPAKELPNNGVYRWANGKVQLVVADMTRPNGIDFSPDYKTLYVANCDEARKVWMAYDVAADGTVSNGRVFADATSSQADGLPDGLKVDEHGNVYATGPGGVWIYAPDGKHLGTIKPPETPANCGWGDDGKSLYMTARTGLYRIKLNVAGRKPLYQ